MCEYVRERDTPAYSYRHTSFDRNFPFVISNMLVPGRFLSRGLRGEGQHPWSSLVAFATIRR